MQLIENMESELSEIWGQAINADNFEIRNTLMKEYRKRYRTYKKQILFMNALGDIGPKEFESATDKKPKK